MTSAQGWTGRTRKPRPERRRQLLLVASLALLPAQALASNPSGTVAAEIDTAPPASSVRRPPLDPPLRAARRFLLERARERYEAADQPGSDTRAELERAIDALGLARSIDPAPYLSFNLAQIYGRLGDCARARDLYQQLLDAKLGGKLQVDTEQALAVLGECETTAADGHDLPPLSAEQELEPTLRLPASWRLAADLPPARWTLPQAEADEQPRAERARSRHAADIWPWALGSLAALAGGVATGYWWRAASLKEELEGVREAGPEVPRIQERGRSAQTAALVWSGLSTSLALGAAGSYLWLRQLDESEPADVSEVSWWGVEGGGGITYRARF